MYTGSSYGDAARLEALTKWLAILYPDHKFDVTSRLAQLHKERASSRRPGLCVRYVYGALDDVVERSGLVFAGLNSQPHRELEIMTIVPKRNN